MTAIASALTGIASLINEHPAITRVVVLAIVFLSGCIEAFLIKSRAIATMTWLLGLAAACIWIADSGTPVRVAASIAAFLCGLGILIAYHRRRPRVSDPSV